MLEGMLPEETLAAAALGVFGINVGDPNQKRFIARGASGEAVPFEQALSEQQDPEQRAKMVADMNALLQEGAGEQKSAADALTGAAESLSAAAVELSGASGGIPGGVNRSDNPTGAGGAGG